MRVETKNQTEMKKILSVALMCAAAVCAGAKDTEVSVLQWNIWQEGTSVKGGAEAIVEEIARLQPDFVTLSEVRNYNGVDYTASLVEALKSKGVEYHSFRSDDTGLLSRYPITDTLTVFPLCNDHGSIYRLLAEKEGKKLAVYTAHLDYLDDAYYNVRGYDGSTWKEIPIPATVEEVLERNVRSQRDDAIKLFIKQAEKDMAAGYTVILGGDFNEPSHRDWTAATADMFDHRSLRLFGYKTHIAMSDERIITAATVTSGERGDGPQLEELVEQSRANGMVVETVVGDAAYSGKDNIILSNDEENGFELVARLNPAISNGVRKEVNRFDYNKDAGMFVCPAGHMAIRKARQGKKGQGQNQSLVYFFDVVKCRTCSRRNGCYKEGAKSKTYSVQIKSEEHQQQADFEKTEEFRTKAKVRYKIEAKNSELKNVFGYDRADSYGIDCMRMQGAMVIFAANIKRILRLS